MKKLTTLLIVGTLALLLTFGLTACGDKTCEHIYDSACDTICNKCEETREVTTSHIYDDCADIECNECGNKRDSMHTWNAADCDTPKTCKVCGATEGEKFGHKPEADDGDCTTEIKCGVCGEVTTAGKTEHIGHADDNDCTTPVTCTACNTVVVTAKTHDFTGDWVSDADGHWHVCKNEGCTVTDSKTDHDEASNGKCVHCNYVVTVLPSHEHSYTVAGKDATHHWMECTCGAINESTKTSHTAEDDHNCTTADLCACGHTVRAAKDHVAGNDDGNCTTAIPCKNCDQSAVAGNTKHTPEADDGDCTTAVKCAHCEQIALEVQNGHTPGEDDGDCTTAITCKNCSTVTTEARANHEASEDDGDCTTDIICKHCEQVAVAGNANHTPDADDNDCETPIVCSVCGKTTTAAKEHDFTGEWQKSADGHYHICKNDGCTVEDTKVGHSGGDGTATCEHGLICSVCGEYYGALDPDSHASDFYTYETNDKETHKKIHECGVVVDEAEEHTYVDGECVCGTVCSHNFVNCVCQDCGAKIEITGMKYVGDEAIYDAATNTYTILISPDATYNVAPHVEFIGKNLEYYSEEHPSAEMLMIYQSDTIFGEYEDYLYYLVYRDGKYIANPYSRIDGHISEYQYSNDGGQTWSEEKLRTEVRFGYDVVVSESQNGTVTADMTYVAAGWTVNLNVTPDEGYMLDTLTVTDGSGNIIAVENNQFVMPASAVTISATFKVVE